MGRGILLFDIMYIVRGNDRYVVLLRVGEQLAVDLRQLRDVVFLELDVPAVRAEHLTIPVQPFQRLALLPLAQQARQLAVRQPDVQMSPALCAAR